MSEQSYSLDRELKEAQVMASALVPYVYENDVYGKIGMNQPPLTIGSLLLRIRRLKGLRTQMNSGQAATLDQVIAQHDSAKKEWAMAYAKKLTQEGEVRLRDLNTYFSECREDPAVCANNYLPEAQRRTMLYEIAQALPAADAPALETKIKAADSMLRRYVKASDFVWSDTLKPIYPQDTFWWLYSRPPQPTDDRK